MATILLAEDDLFLRDIYTEVLSNEGFIVSVAIDGEEVLQKLKQGSWDLVLMDVVMPKMSGIEVLKKIANEPPQKYAHHIVLMTNSDDIKSFDEVRDITDGYILKSSFTPGELVEKIKQYLKN
ncbi:MAG TPA: response regulator [Candidatus Sulfotelmatobacter sp.]|jgi:CheY-like chemotaxis protein|nr:response regulator [Candidatus Sulfotelmatobacter sp.]